jgi:hypothetical protein
LQEVGGARDSGREFSHGNGEQALRVRGKGVEDVGLPRTTFGATFPGRHTHAAAIVLTQTIEVDLCAHDKALLPEDPQEYGTGGGDEMDPQVVTSSHEHRIGFWAMEGLPIVLQGTQNSRHEHTGRHRPIAAGSARLFASLSVNVNVMRSSSE